MEKRGIYQLVDEDKETREREYLDFEGRKRFVPVEFCTDPSVALADIDSLTTLFENEADLRARTEAPTEGRTRLIYIVYKNNGEKRLSCLYNDPTLHTIASKAVGPQKGKINLYDNTTKSYLFNIYNEIRNKKSDFSEFVYYKTKNSYLVNDHNKELLRELHADTSYTERDNNYQLKRFIRSFESYKEFRALYVCYKQFNNMKRLEQYREEQAHKDEIKCLRYQKEDNNTTNKQLPGQISMFDN